jgi:hypothetical protein
MLTIYKLQVLCDRSQMRMTDGVRKRTKDPRVAAPCVSRLEATIRGPISSASWNANTTSGQSSRDNVRCEEPDSRLIVQPLRKRAARSRLALTAPHWLMPRGT